MHLLRGLAAIVAVVLLSLTIVARAEPDPLEQMPVMPEQGKDATATMPALGGMSGRGSAPGGLEPARVEKSMRAARAGVTPPLRGEMEATLFATYARSVVLILTKDGLGSGAVISTNGTIITNAHVVGRLKTVGVIYKPLAFGAEPKASDAVEAKVIRVDEIADLALIKVTNLPSDIRALHIADISTVSIGTDVHAIGHPLGEAWSYTKGIVSQIRLNYEWETEDRIKHKADVIQTQTPISPGNSGGPLLNDAGQLVGVNSFGRAQGTDLNFAIAPTDVRRVIAMTSDRLSPAAQVADAPKSGGKCDEPVRLGTKRTKKDDGTMFVLDADCNGRADSALLVPDDKSEGIYLMVDINENGKIDVIYVDRNRDLKFDVAYYDTNEDGKTDLVGYDLDDNLKPGRVALAKA